jgi:hypothetical protein
MTEDIIATLAKLPARPSIAFRGMSGQAPQTAITVAALMPTSLDPRYASENFTAEYLAAIVSITGRFIGPMSQRPEEQELAILPGTVLLRAGSVEVPGLQQDVVVFAEPGSAPGLPADSADLKVEVAQRVSDALARPAVQIHSPGRFTPLQSQG